MFKRPLFLNPMNRQILKLALPNIVTNITVPLLSMVDLAVLGHLESEIYLGAIALGGVIFNFLYWGFGFLRMGTSGFTAQALGERNLTEAMSVLARALLVAGIAGITLVIMQYPIGWAAFKLLEGSDSVKDLAREYFSIRIFAAPATLALYSLTGWFIGMQNTRTPMIIAIVINLINIGLNLVFVLGWGMKSDGVALATVIAQYLGLALALFMMHRYYKRLYRYFQARMAWKWKAFKHFFSVNTDILVRTLFLIFVFSFFTSESAARNDRILAVNTLLLQFLMIFSYFTDGFAYAAESLVGKYTGARNRKGIKQVIRLLFRWGLGISIPFTLIYLIFGTNILHLLTNNQEVIEASKPFFFWVVVLPIAGYPSYLWDGIYIGATASKALRNTMITAAAGVFIPVYLLTEPIWQNHGLWLALLLFLIARGAAQWIWSKKAIYAKLDP